MGRGWRAKAKIHANSGQLKPLLTDLGDQTERDYENHAKADLATANLHASQVLQYGCDLELVRFI